MTAVIRACALLAAAFVAGCGFHLQGAVVLPAAAATPYIDAPDPYSDFYQALSDALVRSGAQLATDRGDASATLVVQRDETGQNVLSVSARNVPTEYEVFYTVSYELRRGEEVLIPMQTVTLTEDYVYDVTDVVAKSLEEESLRVALAKDIAQMILRRLASL